MIDVRIPKMGMSTVEVDIVEISVTLGQCVAPGDGLVEIESDKANYTIRAQIEGVVREILVEEGEIKKVGDIVVRLEEAVRRDV